MEKEIFSVCDYAQDNNGKLIMINPFDTIWAKKFPAVHGAMTVTGRIKFNKSEVGNHKFEISLLDENDFQVISTISGESTTVKPTVGQYSTVNIVINLYQVKFEKSGTYFIKLRIDNEELATLPINLVNR